MSDLPKRRRGLRVTPTPYDIEAARRRRLAEADFEEWERREAIRERQEREAMEAQTKARECNVPVRPGFGQAAYRNGCEDEWIDRMQSRYEEEY